MLKKIGCEGRVWLCVRAALLGTAAAAVMAETTGPARLHLPAPPARVRVVRKTTETSYMRIPSPGHHYDELLYDVKIGTAHGRHYLHSTLRLTAELDDEVTIPYVRLLDTNGVEFLYMSFTNATIWSTGGQLKASYAIGALPRHYWIACGYAFYRDTMYAHAQGGPHETVIDAANGRILRRGPLRNVHDCTMQIDQHSGLMHVGDTLHARLAQSQYDLDYRIYDEDSGILVRSGTNVGELVISPKLAGTFMLALNAGTDTATYWREFRRVTVLPKLEWTDDMAHLGRLAVNDSIACGLSNDHHIFLDGRVDSVLGEENVTDRLPGSKITNFWDGAGRIMAYDRGFFAYTIGLNLKRGQPYVLEIQYPEDAPRTMALVIGNGVYTPGIHTGHTLGQPEPRFFAEQIMFPLSKHMEKAQFIVWPGEREVRNGLLVGIADPGVRNAPFSHKPLVFTITLYNMMTLARPRVRASFPPELQRFAWTECERAVSWDNARYLPHVNSIFYGLNALAPSVLSWNDRDDDMAGIMTPSTRYVRYVRRMVGGVEYETTVREDAAHHYNYLAEYNDWARTFGLAVMPVLEYGGSDMLPPEARAVAADGDAYPPVRRSATGRDITDSVDVCHPAVQDDARALVREIVTSLTDEQKSVLRPLILRRRAEFLSTAYNDATLQRFLGETGRTCPATAPAEVRAWIVSTCHDAYRRWYQSNLLAFAAAVQQEYAQHAHQADGPALYYHWRQPGMPFEGVYFQTAEAWTDHWSRVRCVPFEGFPLPAINADMLVKAVSAWTTTEEGLYPDLLPQAGVLPVMPVYGTVAAATHAYAALFRGDATAVKITRQRLSPARVHRRGRPPLAAGSTMYRSREHVMYDALLAFVNYNPRYLAFDQSHPPCFPAAEYARQFIANFLALPALPLENVPQPGQAALYVGMARIGTRTYLAIANLDFMPLEARVHVPLPAVREVMPLTGAPKAVPHFVHERGIIFNLSLAPLELRSVRVDE